jgi:hypothetical protein
LSCAAAGPPVEGIPGPDRAVLYILSAWTGFRRKELSSLTAASFDLAADPPSVRVEAAYAKNRRTDEIPLHAGVVERLRPFLVEKAAAGRRLFPLRNAGSWRKTAKMMRADLAAARAEWINEAETAREKANRERSDFLAYQSEAGLFADFHATGTALSPRSVAPGSRWQPPRNSPAIRRRN